MSSHHRKMRQNYLQCTLTLSGRQMAMALPFLTSPFSHTLEISRLVKGVDSKKATGQNKSVMVVHKKMIQEL